LGIRDSRFSLYGMGHPFWAIVDKVSLLYYLLELGMSWREGGHIADRGFSHLRVHIFTIQLETLPGGLSCSDLLL
jgi:hypothetical protein